jgi:iron complex transport system permease protein
MYVHEKAPMNRSSSPLPTTTLRVMSVKRAAAIWLALAGIALAVLMASLALGSVSLAPARVLAALLPAHAPHVESADLAGEIVRMRRLACAGGCAAASAVAQSVGRALRVRCVGRCGDICAGRDDRRLRVVDRRR